MVGLGRWSVQRSVVWTIAVLVTRVLSDDILVTSGFDNCNNNNNNSGITVDNVNIKYNNADKTVSFNVAGTSAKEQNVTAKLSVTAFGQNVYSNEFNPCAAGTFVKQLCPGTYFHRNFLMGILSQSCALLITL
jgi:hypothetical protein